MLAHALGASVALPLAPSYSEKLVKRDSFFTKWIPLSLPQSEALTTRKMSFANAVPITVLHRPVDTADHVARASTENMGEAARHECA